MTNVHAVEVNAGASAEQWSIDENKTRERREAKRQWRKTHGRPVREWWARERARILAKDLDPLLLEAYRSSFSLGPRFRQEFIEFWGLPEDFSF